MADKPTTEEIPINIEGAQILLKIDPDMVNKTVAAAILSSGIGDMVKKEAEHFLNNEETGWGKNGLRKVVGEEMTKVVIELCTETEIREQMRQKIRDAITDGLIDKVVQSALMQGLKQIEAQLARGY